MILLAKRSFELIKKGEWKNFLSAGMPGFEDESEQRRLFFLHGLKLDEQYMKIMGKMSTSLPEDQLRDITILALWKKLDLSQCDRLKNIKNFADNISFSGKNILDILENGEYTKIWLSNIMGYKDAGYDFAALLFQKLARALKRDGLFYSTEGILTQEYLEQAYQEGIIPRGIFVLDEERTHEAQQLQDQASISIKTHRYGWEPCVFKKVFDTPNTNI